MPPREPARDAAPPPPPSPRRPLLVDPRTVRPRALAVVCTGVLLEAVLLAGLAVLLVVDLVRGLSGGQGRGSVGPVVFLVVLALGLAVLLWRAALALAGWYRWPRGPVLLVQVLLVIISAGWASSGAPAAVLLLTALALVVGGGLLTPTVVAVTTAGREH